MFHKLRETAVWVFLGPHQNVVASKGNSLNWLESPYPLVGQRPWFIFRIRVGQQTTIHKNERIFHDKTSVNKIIRLAFLKLDMKNEQFSSLWRKL